MQLSRLLFRIALLVFPVAIASTIWLYMYPVLHGCAFPVPPPVHAQSLAPFRLLSLGDPQLEGDSSLPDPNAPVFPSVVHLVPRLREAGNFTESRDIAKEAARGVVKDARRWVEGKRKAIDLWGNDWYLAHIVRSLRWWTAPTHVSVLGDLLGSQWVTDGEFSKRAARYWHIVMRGLEKVPDAVYGADEEGKVEAVPAEPTAEPATERESQEEEDEDKEEDEKAERKPLWGGTTEVLGADKRWEKRVINIVGNHDVGYAGDIDESRIGRFERAFGSVNWDIWFTLPDHLRFNKTALPSTTPNSAPALRLVILNSMNLDTPAWSSELQSETYAYVNHIITSSLPVEDKTHATILLTHIPLEKETGICVDSPYFDFFQDGQGVKEQNMLSGHASKIVIEGIFGMSLNKDAAGGGLGRRGIVVNGHDHAGCDVVHYIRQPGVQHLCHKDQMKREEAYWPASTADEAMIATSMDIDGVDINLIVINDTDVEPGSGANETESIPESSTEPPADPAQAPPPLPSWKARRYPSRPFEISPDNECTRIDTSPHIREITLRSMMGEFSGYAGFLSAWFDENKGEKGEWVFEFSTCGFGVQHWWWGVHVLDLICVVALVGSCSAYAWEKWVPEKPHSRLDTDTGKACSRSVIDAKDASTIVHSNTHGNTSSDSEVTKRRL